MAKNNEIKVTGRLGKDSRTTDKGTFFSIAVWNGKDKPPLWFDVAYFHATKLTIPKGDEVTVVGKFDTAEYEGKLQLKIFADRVDGKFSDDDFLEE
jgi:hypothetical protein